MFFPVSGPPLIYTIQIVTHHILMLLWTYTHCKNRFAKIANVLVSIVARMQFSWLYKVWLLHVNILTLNSHVLYSILDTQRRFGNYKYLIKIWPIKLQFPLVLVTVLTNKSVILTILFLKCTSCTNGLYNSIYSL